MASALLGVRGEFEYRYDMGDDWCHRFQIESQLEGRKSSAALKADSTHCEVPAVSHFAKRESIDYPQHKTLKLTRHNNLNIVQHDNLKQGLRGTSGISR